MILPVCPSGNTAAYTLGRGPLSRLRSQSRLALTHSYPTNPTISAACPFSFCMAFSVLDCLRHLLDMLDLWPVTSFFWVSASHLKTWNGDINLLAWALKTLYSFFLSQSLVSPGLAKLQLAGRAKHLWAYNGDADNINEAGMEVFGVWNTAWGQAASSLLRISVNHSFQLWN